MTYKIGDVVITRSPEWLQREMDNPSEEYADSIVGSMIPYGSMRLIVANVWGESYGYTKVNLAGAPCNWDVKWFEPPLSPKGNKLGMDLTL